MPAPTLNKTPVIQTSLFFLQYCDSHVTCMKVVDIFWLCICFVPVSTTASKYTILFINQKDWKVNFRLLRHSFERKKKWRYWRKNMINLLKPTGYVMHQQFNIQQLYALPTLYLCVLYLSENKQPLVSRYKLTGFCNRDEKWVQRGTDWIFK
jgi:hypothetical protein